MKLALLHDTICVVDMERKLFGTEEQVGGYDLIYRNGFVKFNQHCTYTTFLGAHNNRERQLRKMWKAIRKKRATMAETTSAATGQGVGQAQASSEK
jgi:hypothetical protein